MAPVQLILVGDSTMANRTGYGDALCSRFRPELTCSNLARGGRSSKSYRVEGLWDAAIMQLKAPGDFKTRYMLIQFGHNDQPGKAERSTTLPEFTANLHRYIKDVRDVGGLPVLVTPLTRRQFKHHILDRGLEPWADIARGVAKQEHVPLLDLFHDSASAVERLGAERAMAFAPSPPSPDLVEAARAGTTIEAIKTPNGFDYTHLGAQGAAYFSAMVANEISAAIPALRTYLRDAEAISIDNKPAAAAPTAH